MSQRKCPTCGIMFTETHFPYSGGRCSEQCASEYREQQRMQKRSIEASEKLAQASTRADDAVPSYRGSGGGSSGSGVDASGFLSKVFSVVVLLALIVWGIWALCDYIYRAYKSWDDTELVDSVKVLDKENKPLTSWEVGRKIILSRQNVAPTVTLKVPWYDGRVKGVRCLFVSDLQQPIEVNSWGWNMTARLVNYEHINGELVIILNKCDFDKADLLPTRPTTKSADVSRELEHTAK